MISCRNVAKLLMSDQLEAQGWWKSMQVRLHLAMCKICSKLELQIQQMRKSAKNMSEQSDADPDLEERILRRLSGR